jgi:hypothetical protein
MAMVRMRLANIVCPALGRIYDLDLQKLGGKKRR